MAREPVGEGVAFGGREMLKTVVGGVLVMVVGGGRLRGGMRPTTKPEDDHVLQGGKWHPRAWTTALDGASRSIAYRGVPPPKPDSLKEVVGEWYGRVGGKGITYIGA